MDNLQPELNVELSWLGGFFNADGSVSFRIIQSRKYLVFRPVISFCNTEEDIIKRIYEVLRLAKTGYYVSGTKPRKPHWSFAWDIKVEGMKRCARFAPLLYPYVYGIKKKRLQWVIEFCEKRLSLARKNAPLDEADILLVDKVRKIEISQDIRTRLQKEKSMLTSSETTEKAMRKLNSHSMA